MRRCGWLSLWVFAGCTPAVEAGVERRARIDAELTTLGAHAWAGRYDSIGEIWRLAPRAGYVVDQWTCAGNLPGHHGSIEQLGPRALRLAGKGDVHVVPWGAQTWLVPDGRLVDFCNDVNSGFDAWLSAYPSRRSDEQRSRGMPDVPPDFRVFLLERPVTAKVVDVLATGAQDVRFTLDAGADSGLHIGMALAPPGSFERAIVERVDADRCELRCATATSTPRTGQIWTTRPWPPR